MRDSSFQKFFWILILTGLALGAVPAIVLPTIGLMDSQLMAEEAAHQDADQDAHAKSEPPISHKSGEKKESSTESGSSKSLVPRTVVDETVVEDIRKVREENLRMRNELEKKEADLKAREKVLNEEVRKLSELRAQISKTQDERRKENEEKVNKLVETLLAMSPRAASKMLSTVDTQLAVAAMEKMDTQPLAKIMNVMDTSKSSKLSEMLTGVVKSREEIVKGGSQK
jgi:flagellar motility protein MotE (MotC chaperone)